MVVKILNTITVVCSVLTLYFIGETFYYLHKAHEYREEFKKNQQVIDARNGTFKNLR